MRRWAKWVCAGLLAIASSAGARLLEEQIDVPVQVRDAWGKPVSRSIRVTVFSDDTNPRPAPVLVLNHGRSPQAEGRAQLGRARYATASQFFVRRGFIVAVPTRVGYGVTGGDDVERSGACDQRNYPPVFAAAAEQSLRVLQAVRQRPDAAQDRAVVVGQSFGGATAVAVAALNPPGVQAAINFAGGGGGNPETRPQSPCSAASLEQLFSDYGKTARVPTLWIYAENDRYFGPTLPREWFEIFTSAGGRADWVQFSPRGEDGHHLFTRFPQDWQPVVAEFLDAQGFKAPTPRP